MSRRGWTLQRQYDMRKENSVALLDAQEITKIYPGPGDGLVALSRLSFCVLRGEMVVISGISGSGKTTLLNILGCLDRPTVGKLSIDGVDTGSLNSDGLARLRGERIGFVFQQSNLIHHLTAIENVTFPLLLAGLPADKERGMAMLESVGLGSRAHH